MPHISGFVVLVVLALTASLFFTKDRVRHLIGNITLLACTIGTLLFFQQLIGGESRLARSQALATAEHAESTLKLMTNVNIGISKFYELFGSLKDSKGQEHSAIEVSSSGLNEYFKKTESALKEVIADRPEDNAAKAKLVLLLNAWGKHADLMKSTCEQLRSSKEEPDHELGRILWLTCVEKKSAEKPAIEPSKKIIESKLMKGWYRDQAFLALYKATADRQTFLKFAREIEDKCMAGFCLGICLFTIGGMSAFVGLVVIIIHLGTLARKEAPPVPDEKNFHLNVSYRTIYAVFVGWMCSQLGIAELMKAMPKNLFSLGSNPVGICLFSFVSYTITMLPALILIYLLAVKPAGVSFWQAMRVRFETSTAGPFKLMLYGYLSWSAIIPCVLVMAIASTTIGSQGSDNPVLAQIAAIAGSRDVLAITILLSTVAVLAPICEEIIFRGFLYSALRYKIGVLPAVLISAFIFAGIHCDLGGMLMLLGLGPVLALALERTRSLVPSMIAHGLWNGGSFAFALATYFN